MFLGEGWVVVEDRKLGCTHLQLLPFKERKLVRLVNEEYLTFRTTHLLLIICGEELNPRAVIEGIDEL